MYSNLAKMRKERKITQKQMSEVIGCTVYSYNRKELGNTNFKINEMEIIQKFFKKPLDEIFEKYDAQ